MSKELIEKKAQVTVKDLPQRATPLNEEELAKVFGGSNPNYSSRRRNANKNANYSSRRRNG